MLLGTFFVALALLLFEVLSARTMSFVLGSGYVYFVIGLAMLGLSAAGSIMSLMRLQFDARRRDLILYWSCVALAVIVLANFLLSAIFKDYVNAISLQQAKGGGFEGVILNIISSRLRVAMLVGLMFSIPYFAFGFIITLIFATSREELYNKIYFADLIGASLGCVAAVVLMEYSSFAASAVAAPMFCLLAGAAYIRRQVRPGTLAVATLAAALPLLLMLPAPADAMEPRPELHSLARDYDVTDEVSEIWRGWNSFTRVSAVQRIAPDGEEQFAMALGNGEGHALVKPYQPEGYEDWDFMPSRLAVALGPPQDVLVLFAGVGADMLAIHDYTDGASNMVGVELNARMLEGAVELPQFRLQEFYDLDNVNLVAEEARAFLEQDDKKYDVILLSFSGATTAYYSGSIGHTTQFVYTKEALVEMLDHLKPGGMIVYINTNKINTLAALREIFEESGQSNVEQSVIVVYEAGTRRANWSVYWDENPLLIKPGGFSEEEVERILDASEALGLETAYAPGRPPNPDYWPYDKVLKAPDLNKALAELRQETNLRFSVVTDDRPFSFDLFLTKRYFSREFWQKAFTVSMGTAYEHYRQTQLIFVMTMIVTTVVLVLGPLLFTRGPRRNWSTANHFVYFFALGAGFMFVEVGMMHKMSLLFGHPGLSIAIVLAGIILSAGIGSLASGWTFRNLLWFRSATLLLLAYVALYLLASDWVVQRAMGWGPVAKGWLVIAIVVPGGFLMGHLFPQGLAQAKKEDTALVPWAWAINGAVGTIAAGISPLLAQVNGFKMVVIAGGLCYALILLLPRYRKGALAPSAA